MVKEHDIVVDLYRHELAAAEIYQDVLKYIEDAKVKSKLQEIADDHRNHSKLLFKLAAKTGNKPIEMKNIKGTLLLGYASVISMAEGQEGALKAIQTTENMVLKKYKEASNNRKIYSKDIRAIVQNHLKDEERYKNYMDIHIT
ncbi:ferritin-like domain-containing protein [Rickettsiales endosymbiont of Stachyamoeba lipophora]|uniref:ferritin-like domain-containing protein n=1 Tax=Rickettsiales endosymbiont of Stachyamoeba lipophora TaxID=2486578 RepID=UPI000F648ACA|nr:ferritin-like domain-containing protein [Rickettsiales endosymbiont of Stachyamoeba lipophora]AZL16259.1 ferritin-like domain-containing protein [Rickettsiales endosymbiont of Stachyamoeba lipophora]